MIEIENIKLRKLLETDKYNLARNANNFEIWLNLTDVFPHPYTILSAEEFIDFCNKEQRNLYLCIDIANECIGIISLSLKKDVRHKTGEIGYWLAQSFWGQGIMSKVIKAFVNFCFTNYDLERIEANVYEWNTASLKILEKNGFTKEGIAKNSAFKNNKLTNEHKFALLKNEFLNLK